MNPPPVREDDRVLLVLPLFHVYGLNAGFGLVAATGACAVLQETFDPRASLALMAEEHVTAVPGRPADVPGLARRGRRRSAATPSCAAGSRRCGWPPPAPRPLPVRRLDGDARPRRRHRLGGLRPDRGLAGRRQHAGHRAGQAQLHRRAPARRGARSSATPPTTEVAGTRGRRRRPPRGARARSGSAAPNLFAGYWPDGADGPDADGWLGTGDLAYRDADGDLHLVDRRSDLILVSGFNVYPAEVERVLDAHPAVAESAVIGVPDPRTGSAVRAVVVVRPGGGAHLRGAAGARRRVPGPLQGADVGALPGLAAALPDRQGQPGPAPRAGAHRSGDRRRTPPRRSRWAPVAEPTPRLQLLTRAGCHLCDVAAETLARIGAEAGLEPQAVDVDADPELQAEYGDRVPVVLLDGREHSYFTVDVERLRRDLDPDREDPDAGVRVVVHHSATRSGRSARCGRSGDFVPAFTSGYRGERGRSRPRSDVRVDVVAPRPAPAGGRARPLWRARDPAAAPDDPGGHRRPPGGLPPGADRSHRERPEHRLIR